MSTGAADSGSFDELFRRAKLREQMFGEPARDLMVGRYRVVERIGAGAMGVVYLALDDALERQIAVKMLKSEDEVARERMLREARALARLAHPNVVTVHEVGTHEGQVYLAMEFVEGTTVREWLETKPSVDAVLDVYRQAAKGLQAAHDAGIVHRDFKPENTLVGADGRVRVLDFGLARPPGAELASAVDGADANTDLTRPTLTRTGMFAGTPAYMAPEQFAGTPVDARADQFAFCVSLHEALHGTRPFQGDSLVELANKVMEGQALTSTSRGVSPRIDAAIHRGIATDPERRFPSMHALAAALGGDVAAAPRKPAWWLIGGAGVALTATMLLGIGVYLVADVEYGTDAATFPGREVGAATPTAAGTCDMGAAKAGKAWSQKRRDAIEANFLSTSKSYAKATWPSVAAQLDAYADAWAKAYDGACAATLELGAADHDDAYRQMRCLDRRLAEFDALATAFGSANPSGLADAATAAASLFPVSDCQPGAASSFFSPDGPLADDAKAPMDELARIRAMRATGDTAEARAASERLAREAREGGLEPIELEARILAAALAVERNSKERIATLDAAAAQARETGQVRLMVLATVEMLEVLAQVDLLFHQGDFDTSELAPGVREWAAQSRAAIAESAPRSALAARLHEALAHDHRSQKEFAEAREHLERALELRLALGNDVAVAHTRYALGWLESDAGEHARAEEELRAAAALQARALGQGHPARAQTLMRLAAVHYQQDEVPRALDLMNEALAINEAALPLDHLEIQRARQAIALFESTSKRSSSR